MIRSVLALLAVLLSAAHSEAQSTVSVLGEEFARKHEKIGASAGLVEFLPAEETLQNWTRLVGYRAIFDGRQSPAEAAVAVGRLADQRYPGAKARVLTKGSEAIVEFVLAAPGGVVEFNVFKFAFGPGRRGVVSIQYARRVRDLDLEDVRRLGARWTNAIARYGMDDVRAAFAAPSRAGGRQA